MQGRLISTTVAKHFADTRRRHSDPIRCRILSAMQRNYRRSPSRSESPAARNMQINRSNNMRPDRSRSRDGGDRRGNDADNHRKEPRWSAGNDRVADNRGGEMNHRGDLRETNMATNKYSSGVVANDNRRRPIANPSDSFSVGSIYKGITLPIYVDEVPIEHLNVTTSFFFT